MDDAVDGIATYRTHPNVILTRTFSKAYGLAGFRVGYAVAQAPLAERSASRLLLVPPGEAAFADLGVRDLPSLLQPGDLLFFYSPVSHVAMYIGNGQMVHASTSSQPVKVVGIDSMGGITAMRRIL